ncbi:MAG: hypothetical protein PHP22_12870 [Oscillospiraceae bacterium]|nr:hypothetical protein [Oscillospiraceae bacterium]
MPNARKIISNRDAPYIRALVRLIETQSKSTLTHWAVDYAQWVLLPIWKKFDPEDIRPESALDSARRWLSGQIKLPEAKAKILLCHEAAREAQKSPAAQAAARARKRLDL